MVHKEYFNINNIFPFLNETLDIVNQIEGYKKDLGGMFSRREGMALYMLAKFGPGSGEIVEIGSWKGKSTIWLAKGSRSVKREKVTAVDPFEGILNEGEEKTKSILDEFKDNLANFRCNDWVNINANTSEGVSRNWNKKIRLLFIDGLHDYDNVKKDFLLWEPHLIKGGIIAFHDYDKEKPGVMKVVDEYINKNDKYVNVAQCGQIFIGKKVR